MQKYIEIFKYEMKNVIRDKMTLMMIVYPFLMIFISSYLIPKILESVDTNSIQAKYASLIMFITLISMGTFIIIALFAFVLLDRKDEKTLYSISATPLSVTGYIKFQATYYFILSVISNLLILIGTKLLAKDAYSYTIMGNTVDLFGNLTYDKIIIFSIVSSLYMPALALLLSAISNNKIEGFAYMKFSGFLILIPILLVLDTFNGGLQYILGITPNFWSIKGLMVTVMPENDANMNFWLYMLIGTIYGIILIIPSYKFFIKRALRT